jgi:hypothetical protein
MYLCTRLLYQVSDAPDCVCVCSLVAADVSAAASAVEEFRYDAMLLRRYGHDAVHYVVYLQGGNLFFCPAGRSDDSSITRMDVAGSTKFEWIRTGSDLQLTYRAERTDRDKNATLKFKHADELDDVVRCFGTLRPLQARTGSVVQYLAQGDGDGGHAGDALDGELAVVDDDGAMQLHHTC